MELYLSPIKQEFNKKNGQFLKGHTPFNRGKKMTEWMDGRKIKRVLKCLSRKGNPSLPGCNKRQVIGIKDGKIVGAYSSSEHAARKLGIIARNIRHCCEGKRKRCGGVEWFYESDFKKWNKLLTN